MDSPGLQINPKQPLTWVTSRLLMMVPYTCTVVTYNLTINPCFKYLHVHMQYTADMKKDQACNSSKMQICTLLLNETTFRSLKKLLGHHFMHKQTLRGPYTNFHSWLRSSRIHLN